MSFIIFLIFPRPAHPEQLFSITCPWCSWNLSVYKTLTLLWQNTCQSHCMTCIPCLISHRLPSTVCFQDHSMWRPTFMEFGPASWRTCRLPQKIHEFQQLKPYSVPKVGMTTHLKNQILWLIMVRITWNFIGTSAYQGRLPVQKEKFLPHLFLVLGL